MKLFFALISAFMLLIHSCHGQRLNCHRPKTDADKYICNNEHLLRLDEIMEHLYQKGVELSDNPEKINLDHQKWLAIKAKIRLIPGDNNKLRVENLYSYRLKLLWRPSEKLRQYMASYIFDGSKQIDRTWFALAVIALWDHHEQVVNLFAGTVVNVIDHIRYVNVSSTQMVVAFPVDYRFGYYSFLIIEKKDGKISIDHYELPFPKEYNGFDNWKIGLFWGGFEFDNQQKTITYHSKYDPPATNHHCVWKLTPDGPQLISYKQLVS